MAEADSVTFPVVNSEVKLISVMDWEDIRRVLGDEDTIAELIVARDMVRVPVTLNLDDNLLTAIRKMNNAETAKLIVVDPEQPGDGDLSKASCFQRCEHRINGDGYPYFERIRSRTDEKQLNAGPRVL